MRGRRHEVPLRRLLADRKRHPRSEAAAAQAGCSTRVEFAMAADIDATAEDPCDAERGADSEALKSYSDEESSGRGCGGGGCLAEGLLAIHGGCRVASSTALSQGCLCRV